MLQAAPQLQVLLCAKTASVIPSVNAAEFEMQPISKEDRRLLLSSLCKCKVSITPLP